MLSFGALNAITSEDSSTGVFHEVQKEEQEATALHLYNEAISLEKENSSEAVRKFEEVINCDLLQEAPESLQENEIISENPALFLKYNVLKKLAGLAEKNDDKEKAINYFLEAAVVDESDISLWWRVGTLSMDVVNLRLARFAFEKGLVQSPNHWLCLDQLISVLYIIGDYHGCLEMISYALERKTSYEKGFAFRDQIFKEEPHFKKTFLSLSFLYTSDEDEDCEDRDKNERESKYQKHIEEALVVRGRRKLQAKREEANLFKVNKPLPFYSWYCLSETLLHIYRQSTKEDSEFSLAFSVDLSKLSRSKEQQANLPVPSPDLLAKKYAKSIKENESSTSKGIKRKKLNLSSNSNQEKELEPQPKRRSSRVTKLSKAKELDVNLPELVYSYLPSNFRPSIAMETDESQDSTVDSCESSPKKDFGSVQDYRKEAIAVSNFINKHLKQRTCITIMEEFLITLSDTWNQKWQKGLASKYINIYEKFKKHVQWPNIFDTSNLDYSAKIAKIILLALELQLDAWLNKRNGDKSVSCTNLSFKDEMKSFHKDLNYISLLASNNDLLLNDGESHSFVLRFFYLYGRSCMEQNLKPLATNSFCNCLDFLSKNSSTERIELHNCGTDNVIDKENIDKMIDRLNQSQTTDELQQIFDAKDFQRIISTLEPCLFKQNRPQSKERERPVQLYFLTEAYNKTNSFQKCLDCVKLVFQEAIKHDVLVESWKSTANKILGILNRLFLNEDARKLLTQEFINFICEPLIKLMEYSMDFEASDDCEITTLPWLLIYRIVQWNFRSFSQNEEEDEKIVVDIEELSNDSEISSPLSSNLPLKFLRTAHKHLGRKHWCCHDDGVLLLCLVDELSSSINIATTKEREVLSNDLEQCFYCLYGNPCNKAKIKLITDHNVEEINLTWDNCKVMYDFYTPHELPQLNIKTHTISLEVHFLLKKIVSVVSQQDVEVIPFEQVQQFIDGNKSLPSVTSRKRKTNGMDDLFYFLGDFYFKNKEFGKALKFYTHDVCVNPNRFQSWAAMAFTRASRLEEKFNQCEEKTDTVIKKHITSTLRCFEKAVEINNKRCLILEEYGQTSYMIHSYVSRKLKNTSKRDGLREEELYHCFKLRREMLELTEKCFLQAFQCVTSTEGELWLHFYMLGKSAEKLGRSPQVYLDFYLRSLKELYNSGGKFIKKITYRSPPQYSIEAVEMFYRVHASILKQLMYSNELDFDLLEEYLDRVNMEEIYLEILESDKIWLKDYYSACRSKDPIRVLLHELVDNICQEEENCDEIENECHEVLEKIVNEAVTQSENEQLLDCGDLNKNTLLADVMEFSNSDIDIQEILDSIISRVCKEVYRPTPDNRDKQEKDDVTVVKDTVCGLVDQVCKQHSPTRELQALKEKSLMRREFSSVEEKDRYVNIAERCLQGFGFCLRRFHEHYKSQYAMAHLLAHSPVLKNLQWSRDLLLGGSADQVKYSVPLPNHGVFSARKKTNMFQYIWRVPINEIDRPGSFCFHNNQSTVLLLHVLFQLKDYQLLLHVSTFLHKTPDKERKYLRDKDRGILAIKAFEMVLQILESKFHTESVKPKREWKKLLMDSYEAFKHSQKIQTSQQNIEKLLVKFYGQFNKLPEGCSSKEMLDEALKFCQQFKL